MAIAPGSASMSGRVANAGFLASSAANALDASNRKIGPKVITE
jgi:hypothetical protein